MDIAGTALEIDNFATFIRDVLARAACSNAINAALFVLCGKRAHVGKRSVIEHQSDRVAGFEHDKADTAMLLVDAILAAPIRILAGAAYWCKRSVEHAYNMTNFNFLCWPRQGVASALSLF